MIQMYVTDNRGKEALSLIDNILKDNPGDVELVSTKWKVALAAADYKQAITLGDELAKLDPAQVAFLDPF